MSENEAKTAILALIPPTGEVSYDQVYEQLLVSPHRDAVRHFHKLRKAGAFNVRLDREVNIGTLYLSRATTG